MKITKLIIPILGLSQINNKELLQIEKTPEISYEVSATGNWDNYLATENLMQNQIIQLNTQKNEIGEPRPISYGGCEDGCYQTYLTACTFCSVGWINPAVYAVCMAAAGTAYAGCLVLCRQ